MQGWLAELLKRDRLPEGVVCGCVPPLWELDVCFDGTLSCYDVQAVVLELGLHLYLRHLFGGEFSGHPEGTNMQGSATGAV